jgi:catechol 2,3-dioxygenase-like lactoylglutathione lyase family enzyme
MDAWPGQYCINVSDLEASVSFYEALGLTTSSRTEIDQAWEAVLHHADAGSPAKPSSAAGGRMQLAQQKNEPFVLGDSFWKLYINTRDIDATYQAALAAGATTVTAPEQLDRWPVKVAFVTDRDGLLVELVERLPWPDDAPAQGPWLGQYCINVTDIDATVAFYETLGLTCTSRTEIPQAFEAILERPGKGGKIQLAQQKDAPAPSVKGTLWKLYVITDDCVGLHAKALAAGYKEQMEVTFLERWSSTVSFVEDPDGTPIELVQLGG